MLLELYFAEMNTSLEIRAMEAARRKDVVNMIRRVNEMIADAVAEGDEGSVNGLKIARALLIEMLK